jgi:hypothetical protein
MKKLLTTTALALTLAIPGAAFAQTSGTTDPAAPAANQSSDGSQTEIKKTDDMNKTAPADTAAETTAPTAPTPDTAATTSADSDVKTTMGGPAIYFEGSEQGDILASSLIGMRIYATESDVNEDQAYAADARKEWDDIGEVNDVVLNWDGGIKAVVLGVGGFLGMGEKDVAVEISSLKKVRESDDANDWFLVVNSNKEALESAPAYVREKM